ncbi:MAG: DNA-binding response regulator [Anaerolineae bacterium]|nr:MAG: DNA-binding response regulator [Anaerolineae bacterium]
MIEATILIIERKRAGVPSFTYSLRRKGLDVEVASSGSQALEHLPRLKPDVVVVNAASLRSTGVRICLALKRADAKLPVILIVDSRKPTSKAAADVVLTLPFTVQKLYNRIKPLLPGDGKNIVRVGPIRLDVERRRVHCLGKNSRLTPRLVALLQVLLEHRGEVVPRETLFTQVWDTAYTGDTRTLDVHISWLRKAIELDPAHPRFLKTVRGVGYRLDV